MFHNPTTSSPAHTAQSGRPASTGSSESANWDGIHERIQERFRSLSREVLAARPDVVALPGRTSAKANPLYSHCVYLIPAHQEFDALTVGVSFEADRAAGWRIRAEIAGDSTGIVYFDLPMAAALRDSASLIVAADDAARQLCELKEVVLANLEHPAEDYRNPPQLVGGVEAPQ